MQRALGSNTGHGPPAIAGPQIQTCLNIHMTFSGNMGHTGHGHRNRTMDPMGSSVGYRHQHSGKRKYRPCTSRGSSGCGHWHWSASFHRSLPSQFLHPSQASSVNLFDALETAEHHSVYFYPHIGLAQGLWSLNLLTYQTITKTSSIKAMLHVLIFDGGDMLPDLVPQHWLFLLVHSS